MERARDLDGGGPAGRKHAFSDRTVHGNPCPSVGGRAGAVDGVLHVAFEAPLACVTPLFVFTCFSCDLIDAKARQRFELLARGLKSGTATICGCARILGAVGRRRRPVRRRQPSSFVLWRDP